MNGEFTNNGDTLQDHSKHQSKKTAVLLLGWTPQY